MTQQLNKKQNWKCLKGNTSSSVQPIDEDNVFVKLKKQNTQIK